MCSAGNFGTQIVAIKFSSFLRTLACATQPQLVSDDHLASIHPLEADNAALEELIDYRLVEASKESSLELIHQKPLPKQIRVPDLKLQLPLVILLGNMLGIIY
jgi:hypothetical protein